MSELVELMASWHSVLLVILVFGFAPGFVLRLLVMIYPRNDPRRRELVAELYAQKRVERPLWVAEQLETVLFEGLPHRLTAVRFRCMGIWFHAIAKVSVLRYMFLYGWLLFHPGSFDDTMKAIRLGDPDRSAVARAMEILSE